MKCECDSPTRVLETRGTARRRQCGNGHTFWTDEVVVRPVMAVHAELVEREERRKTVRRLADQKAVVIADTLGVTDSYASVLKHRELKRRSNASTQEKA